jgi:o-succinylbenzoate synthase
MHLRSAKIASFGQRGRLVVIDDEAGRVGVGEASPLVGYSTESLDDVDRALRAILPSLEAVDDDGPILESVERALKPHQHHLHRVPSARFAIESALVDLIAQARGIPAARALGGGDADVAVNALVRAEHGACVASAIEAVKRGFRAIKVKIGAQAFERDFACLSAIRDTCPDVELRADANGRYGLEEARSHLEALAPLRLAFVEQPVAPALLPALGAMATPWAADESLRIDGMAERLLFTEACAAFILKPAVLGGFVACVRLARQARMKGLGVVVTHLFDGPVALAATRALALALAPVEACGLDAHPELAAFPAIGAQFTSEPWVRPSLAVGLGVDAESWLRGAP